MIYAKTSLLLTELKELFMMAKLVCFCDMMVNFES